MVEKPIKQKERPPDIVKESSPSTSSGDILESQSARNNSDTLSSVSPHPAPSLDCSNVLSRLGLQTVTSERGGGDNLALRGGADPVAEEVRFACHRCPSILRISSITAHISNCAQHESFFVDGPGSTHSPQRQMVMY